MISILSNLPALLVVLPLVVATFSVFINKPIVNSLIVIFTIIITNIISWTLCYLVWKNGDISYIFGGWSKYTGIEYKLDNFTCYFLNLLCFLSFIVSLQLKSYLSWQISQERFRIFCCLFLFFFSGILAVTITNDLFNMYVFMEVCSLAAYGLVAISKNSSSIITSFLYLIYGTVGTCFILIAIGLIFMITGNLNFTLVKHNLHGNMFNEIKLASLIFMTAGFMLKMAIFPFHSWLAKLYHHSSNLIAGFLSATLPTMYFCLLCKLILRVYTLDQIPTNYFKLLFVLSIITIICSSFLAVKTNKIKEIFAYSSVTNIGFCLLALAIFDQYAFYIIILILTNHAFIKLGLFLVIDQIERATGTVKISELNNLGKSAHVKAGLLIFLLASLVGMPFTAGFINKWHLIQFTVLNQLLGLCAIIISSILSLLYFIKVINIFYFSNDTNKVEIRFKDYKGSYIGITIIIIVNFALAFHNFLLSPLLSEVIGTL